MSNLVAKALKALVKGQDLELGNISVSHKAVRYQGMTVLTYWTNIFNENEHHISFHTDALRVNDNGFVMKLLSAALIEQGVEAKVFVEDDKLFASNGLWNEELRADGVRISMNFIKNTLALAPSVVAHNKGDSEALVYDYEQYLQFDNLEMFCSTNGLSKNQALHSFEVAKNLLDKEPELSDNFVTEVW